MAPWWPGATILTAKPTRRRPWPISIPIAAVPNHGLALVNNGGPVIIQPPVGLTAYTGRDVTLKATAAAAPVQSSAGPQIINYPLSYQWLLNGTNVPGATNTSLLLPAIQLANAGGYQLFVSNSLGTAISLPAPVTVISNNDLVVLEQTTVSATNVYQAGKVTFTGGTLSRQRAADLPVVLLANKQELRAGGERDEHHPHLGPGLGGADRKLLPRRKQPRRRCHQRAGDIAGAVCPRMGQSAGRNQYTGQCHRRHRLGGRAAPPGV